MTEDRTTGSIVEISLAERYLHIPVAASRETQRLRVAVGKVDYSFEVKLGGPTADWWAVLDMLEFHGGSATLSSADPGALESLKYVYASNDYDHPGETSYSESHRPQLRFSPRRGWMNDPNGLIFADGEYHFFFQHNPFGIEWANMHWGHAVSRDLVHWEQLPIALYPDDLGGMYTGSAVVDRLNTADLQTTDRPPLVVMYTAGGRPHTQCLASSEDGGRTWVKYEGNPVIPALTPQSRDPRVFWHEPDQSWRMVMYLDRCDPGEYPEVTGPIAAWHRENTDTFGIFRSADLKDWELLSELRFPEDGECPELFELPVEGNPRETRWVFVGGFGLHLIGTFDGHGFTPESGPHRLHHGDCFYAGQTFSEIPLADGRRLMLGFGMTPGLDSNYQELRNDREAVFSGMPFNQSASLPLELSLHQTARGPRLSVNPARELASLRRSSTHFEPQPLGTGVNLLDAFAGGLWDVELEIRPESATSISLEVRDVAITFGVANSTLSCLGHDVNVSLDDSVLRLRVIVDRSAIDIFISDGRYFVPLAVDLTSGEPRLSLRAHGGTAFVDKLMVHELESIWVAAPPSPSPGRSAIS